MKQQSSVDIIGRTTDCPCSKILKLSYNSLKIKQLKLKLIIVNSEKVGISNHMNKLKKKIKRLEDAYAQFVGETKVIQTAISCSEMLSCDASERAHRTPLEPRGARQLTLPPWLSGSSREPISVQDSSKFSAADNGQRRALRERVWLKSMFFANEQIIKDVKLLEICCHIFTLFSKHLGDSDLLLITTSLCGLEEGTFVKTPKKLARKLRSSFGRSSARKLCPLLDGGDPDTFLQSNPIPQGARYSMLAYTTLGLEQAEGSFQSHSLMILQNVEASSWLPLYGNLCCQLVAQPYCMTQDMMRGYLSQQQSIDGLQRSCQLYCTLRAGLLSCYYSPEEIQAKMEPSLIIPINKDTRIRVVDKDHQRTGSRLTLINPGNGDSAGHVFITETPDVLQEWLDALWQHNYDQSQWQHACNKLMEIEVLSSRKPALFLTKQADSVYNDLSIGSPGKFESLTDIIHNKIEETDGRFLLGQEEERQPPHWGALFEGSRPVVVQKTILSPGKESIQSITSPPTNTKKKRRAPPPPPDKLPFVQPTCIISNQEKENSKGARPRTGRPSMDAKFSAIIQQLQKNHTSSRKNAPLGQIEPCQHTCIPKYEESDQIHNQEPPVPAPRNKLRMSFREKMNPKAW
ncbi:Rhotekin-2 Pleckstrin -like proteiny domain-containing family K member 1 [Triplophysa tibetana]|uniref:Rhotekin-2 Pleckstrin-like proteiny domain-containing family K member 1 n=1 Tax=Triplophysa tibetana TaxID=1572043 RepID=A0A5A9NPN4_9TELE|nr:Rhotekin-2 Pleckstrin -like proteiny domain-containing family K member 1 [Triplophysa tibetana]